MVTSYQPYHRAYAVVPMAGNGTVADALVPMFTAQPRQKKLQQLSQPGLTRPRHDGTALGIAGVRCNHTTNEPESYQGV